MKRRRGLMLSSIVVLALCTVCGVWLHVQQQRYARNRQLIDSLLHGEAKTALTLIRAGADPNTPQMPPPTPTLPQLLKQLLHRTPPSPNNSPTAFQLACNGRTNSEIAKNVHLDDRPEDVTLVQTMLAHGAHLHIHDKMNRTALVDAVSRNRLLITQLLLKHGMNVNAADRVGYTPLHWAAMNSLGPMTRLLLAHGAAVNAADQRGMTPLHHAAESGAGKDVIRLLLAQGADPNSKDRKGVTPLQSAQSLHRPDVVKLLKRETK